MHFQLFLLQLRNARLERDIAALRADAHHAARAIQASRQTLRIARKKLEATLATIPKELFPC